MSREKMITEKIRDFIEVDPNQWVNFQKAFPEMNCKNCIKSLKERLRLPEKCLFCHADRSRNNQIN